MKKYEELELKDNFMFAKVMRNRKLCRKLLETILNVEIRQIEYPEEEKSIDITSDGKSIRLDVYVADEKNTIYNIEMQTSQNGNLCKRSRYYQGMIDLNLIEKGEDYSKLNKSYVIFICTFDLFGKGRHIYTFENLCLQDKEIYLQDEAVKIFLNARGTEKDVSEDVEAFLKYLSGEKTEGNMFVQELDHEVERIRLNKEWRREYMTLQMWEKENKRAGEASKLISQIQKKLAKGKSTEEIAEAVEEEIEKVQAYIQAIEANPGAEAEVIYEYMQRQ